MIEQVLVFRNESLPLLAQSGFIADTQLLPILLSKAEFINRSIAENDPSYKQIIPYSILRFQGEVFRYRRSKGAHEQRLHGLYSIGVGGHINPTDFTGKEISLMAIVEQARDRELAEEFTVGYTAQPRCIGLLNDSSNAVGKVHLGVIYEYWLENRKVTSKEKNQVESYGFVLVEEMASQIQEYENWSSIIIKQYLCVT